MKLLLLSDTHCDFNNYKPNMFPVVDAILHAGDFTWLGRERHKEVSNAKNWVKEMSNLAPFYWIPGNHDIRFKDEFCDIPNTIYCYDKTVMLHEYKVRGVSLSPCYDWPELALDWDFMTCNPLAEEAAYDFEPVDIVLSHSPPLGLLDKTSRGKLIGSECLLNYINKNSPKLVVCGHVHEAKGSLLHNNTFVHNVACSWKVIELDDFK